MAKFNKYRKKIKYKKIEFKFSEQQMSLLEGYCSGYNLTPVKAIKKIVIDYLTDQEKTNPNFTPAKAAKATSTNNATTVSKKQLNLFDLIEAEKAVNGPS